MGPWINAPFQNLPNIGQMKMHRPQDHSGFRDPSAPRNTQLEKAQQEAMRLMRNHDNMFERYLKKP